MSLHRFFVRPECVNDGKVKIEGPDARQICSVLRLGRGDQIAALDGSGCILTVRISEAAVSGVIGDVVDANRLDTELPVKLTLAQALPKADKLELAIQKGTELGVAKFQIVSTSRTIPRNIGDRLEKRLARWRAIAKEAAEQSYRAVVPEVDGIESLEEFIPSIKNYDLAVCLWECEQKIGLQEVLREYPAASSILLIIGPEGGLEEREVRMLEAGGARVASLGKRVLRCETAAIAAAAIVMYEYEMETQ